MYVYVCVHPLRACLAETKDHVLNYDEILLSNIYKYILYNIQYYCQLLCVL